MLIPIPTLRLLDDWTLFSLAAVFSVAFPGSASLKALVLLALWAYLVFRRSVRVNSVVWFLSVLLHLAFWVQVGLVNDVPFSLVLNHATRVLLFFIVLAIGTLVQQASPISQPRVDRLIACIGILSAFIKTAILFVVITGLSTLQGVQSKLGFETVSDSIGFGIQRLQFPSDIILIFLIAAYVGGRSRRVDTLVLLGISVSVLLSFSRYLFAAYFVCLILRALALRRIDFISRVSLMLGLFLFLLFSGSLLARFVGQGALASDGIRDEQIRMLTGSILGSPILGTGLGGSVPGYTRSTEMPFSYEVQWYALTMQMGVLGLLWFLLNMLLPLALRFHATRHKAFFMTVVVLWMAAGFTNPFITSLGSAFGLCLLMARMAHDAPDPAPPNLRRFQIPWMLAYASRRSIPR